MMEQLFTRTSLRLQAGGCREKGEKSLGVWSLVSRSRKRRNGKMGKKRKRSSVRCAHGDNEFRHFRPSTGSPVPTALAQAGQASAGVQSFAPGFRVSRCSPGMTGCSCSSFPRAIFSDRVYPCQVIGMRTSGMYEQYVPVLMVVARCWPKAA